VEDEDSNLDNTLEERNLHKLMKKKSQHHPRLESSWTGGA
jgi:hypothetical protein